MRTLPIDEQPWPRKVWCGQRNANQDVSIRLMPNEIDQQQVAASHSREPVAVVKAHSHRLKECSKYFETCLSHRWANPNPPTSSIETSLELIHGLQVSCYSDCFSRMYTPFRKDFKDVESSLNLLRVASQIEFGSLMSSICRYLSTIVWSVEDEVRIRLYASSVDFPRGQAKDLVTRLEFGDPSSNARGKQLFELLELCMKSALPSEPESMSMPKRTSPSARSLIEELLLSIGRSGSPVLETDLVALISREAKAMLVDFHKECLEHGGYDHRKQSFRWILNIPGFKRKMEGMLWILEVLLKAKVADDVIKCFLQLQSYPKILVAAAKFSPFSSELETNPIAIEFGELVMQIYREAVSGNLLLDILDRVALLENWQLRDLFSKSDIIRVDISGWGYEQAAQEVFLTLPFEQQMQFIKRRRFDHRDVISTKSLATLALKKCRAEEHASLQADADVDMG